ncbi:MAG: preprotein translocase subunit SecG [Elusimicrobia bacterium]|nr:preprotein translocase subunit SecG [Elusimicrobiota bacterium]MBD3412312.1 preprotein translocase subunit SecG [Elusimicrobiota bacterium]
MHTVFLIVHICACIALIMIVLLQAGKSSGLGLFGGGGSEALFNAPSGSAFLKKVTTVTAIVFVITSIVLTYLSSHRGMSTVTGRIRPQPQAQQEQPVPQTDNASPQTQPPDAEQ